MDDLGFNKIGAAIVGTALAFVGIRAMADAVVPEHDFSQAYLPDVVLEVPGGEEEIDLPFPQPSFIAALDVARGEKVFKKCQSCHNAEPGGANGTGPALYGVMGRQMGQQAGFKYSAEMQGRAAPWTWEEMNGFLTKPKEWIPGTAMNYIGLKKEEDRAAVMAYLNAQTNNPLPVPEPVLVAEAGDEAALEVEGLEDVAGLPDADTARTEADPQEAVTPGEDDGEADPVDAPTDGLDDDGTENENEAVEDEGVVDEQNSAGEVTPDDPSLQDPAVQDAIPGEQVATEVEDGPMSADQVLDFLGDE